MFFLIARMLRGGRRRGMRQIGYQQPQYQQQQYQQDERISPQMIRAELSVLADDVLRLEPQVTMNEAARDDYEAATHRYRVAQAAMDQAQDQVDLVRVQRVVDEARWSMSRARAVLAGHRLPEPPPVLQRPGLHGEPAVALDERQNPVYVGSPAPFQSGWFSAGSGLFGGLLLGSMLSGGLFGGGLFGGGFGAGFGGGDSGGDGGFGGGDFGGGDFGGGDW
jgi:hypothetical protein